MSVMSMSTAGFHDTIIDRGWQGADGLAAWSARVVRPGGSVNEIKALAAPDMILLVSRTVVQRGIYRIQGGQRMERPAGLTQTMLDEVQAADACLDPFKMTPATASAVIQVGLFGKVIYS